MIDLVSVIVPVYNVEKFLPECIESILAQTYKEIEILLIDDGSTDNSGRICDRYAEFDSRVSVIHKTNGGLSDARNVGMSEAVGNYYMFIDSDDYISHDLVEKMYYSIKKYDCEISVCNMMRVFEDNSVQPFYQPVEEMKLLCNEEKFETLNQPSVCNKMFYAKLFDDLCFPIGKYYEDTFVYHVLAFRAKKIVHTGMEGYWYRCRKDSILGQPKYTERYFDFLEAVSHRMNYLNDKNIQPYGMEACLSMYAAYSNATKNIKKTNMNEEKFNAAKKSFLIAYDKLMKNCDTNIKQKIRLVLLKYLPLLHNKVY